MTSEKPTISWRNYIRGLLLILSLVLVGYYLDSISTLLDKSWIDSQVRGQGVSGELLFIGVGAIITAVGLPRQMVCFLGGYAFGFVAGSLLSLGATALGCLTAFYYARLLGHDLLKSRYPERIRRIDNFIHDNPFSMTLLIRLLPVGSNVFTNLAAGVSSASAASFLSASAIGYIPQTIIFALIGSGSRVNPEWRIGLGIILFVVSSALGIALYRRYRREKHIDENLDGI